MLLNVICIVGLPGSGKTHLANKIASSMRSIIVDDIDSTKQVYAAINDAIDCNKQLILIDPGFCIKSVRDTVLDFMEEYGNVYWIYFKNDPTACIVNVKRRQSEEDDERNVSPDLDVLSKVYTIPIEVKPINVWSLK